MLAVFRFQWIKVSVVQREFTTCVHSTRLSNTLLNFLSSHTSVNLYCAEAALRLSIWITYTFKLKAKSVLFNRYPWV